MSRRVTPRRRSPLPLVGASLALFLLAGGGVLYLVMRGDDDEPPFTPIPTPDTGAFGRGPTLDGNVTAIYPAHGASVTRAETKTGTPDNPGAVCIRVRFGTTNGTWYRMAVDGVEVTEKTVWIGINPTSLQLPDVAQLCYDPPDGLPAGRIDAAVTVGEPNGISPAQEIVEWSFQVNP